MNSAIIRAVITEKSMALAAKGKFTFIVDQSASKTAIQKEVEMLFSVHVEAIKTTVVKGKTKRVGTRRTEVVQTPWKKAIVLLTQGEKIDLFELGGGENK